MSINRASSALGVDILSISLGICLSFFSSFINLDPTFAISGTIILKWIGISTGILTSTKINNVKCKTKSWPPKSTTKNSPHAGKNLLGNDRGGPIQAIIGWFALIMSSGFVVTIQKEGSQSSFLLVVSMPHEIKYFK